MLIKICGITKLSEIEDLNELKPDYIGFVFAKSKRQIDGKTAYRLKENLDKDIKTKHANKEAAKEVGTLIAKRALEKNIKTIVFDRSGYVYHGVIKELAEAARENGLKF